MAIATAQKVLKPVKVLTPVDYITIDKDVGRNMERIARCQKEIGELKPKASAAYDAGKEALLGSDYQKAKAELGKAVEGYSTLAELYLQITNAQIITGDDSFDSTGEMVEMGKKAKAAEGLQQIAKNGFEKKKP